MVTSGLGEVTRREELIMMLKFAAQRIPCIRERAKMESPHGRLWE